MLRRVGQTLILCPTQNKAYFRSDFKLGKKNAWAWLQSLDRGKQPFLPDAGIDLGLILALADTLISHAQASLIPINKILSKTPYLSGHNPGFADYVAFGR
jgi:hypothetical protein